MIIHKGIRLPYDKMTPAYDMQFHSSVMSFRAPQCAPAPGVTVFDVYDTNKVIYYEANSPDIMFTFTCLPSEYDKMQKIYIDELTTRSGEYKQRLKPEASRP